MLCTTACRCEIWWFFKAEGKFVTEDVPALRAINARLLDDFIADCQGGIDRWNKVIEKAGINFKFAQPHKGFNRKIGEFGKSRISPGHAWVSTTSRKISNTCVSNTADRS